MTEQAQAAAEQAAPQSIPIAEALARYTASKAPANPVSEAARTLGQRGAAARAEARQAQAAPAEEATQVEAQQNDAEDDSQAIAGETLDETATGESPAETEATTEEEPGTAPTIDLGDGVKVTLDEVRDGFMMKADHTRKTQALAEDRKKHEASWTQKLAQLDNIHGFLKQVLPQPQSLAALVKEHGADEGITRHEQQTQFLAAIENAEKATQHQRNQKLLDAQAARDDDLAKTYNTAWSDKDKREAAYTSLTSYALKEGAQVEDLQGLTHPWMIKALDKASKYDAIQANKGNVTKLIAGKPTVVKPGTKVSAQASQQTAVQSGFSKLQSSGKLSDAVALLRTQRGRK